MQIYWYQNLFFFYYIGWYIVIKSLSPLIYHHLVSPVSIWLKYKLSQYLQDVGALSHFTVFSAFNVKANIMTDCKKKKTLQNRCLLFCPLRSTAVYLSSFQDRNLIKAGQGQTSLPLITWGGGDGCDRRGNDAARVEGGELLHLNRCHRGNRREVGRLRNQGLLLHQLEDGQIERMWFRGGWAGQERQCLESGVC